MTIFELKGTRLVPASLGSAAGAPERSTALRAAGGQLVDVLRRPLLTVAHDPVDGGETLVALDPTGQIVTVEVLDRLSAQRLQAAMSRAGTNVAGGRGALGLRYRGGSSALRRDLEALRESAPSQVASPRLVILAASVPEEMRASLLVLAGSAVEIHEISVRSAGDGRVFVTVQPLSPEALSDSDRADASAGRRRSRSADASALSPASTRTDSERIDPGTSSTSWTSSLGSAGSAGPTGSLGSTGATGSSRGSTRSQRRSEQSRQPSWGSERSWPETTSTPAARTARQESSSIDSRWSERSWSEPARTEPTRTDFARPEPSRPEPARPEPTRPEPTRPESWSERSWSEPARTSPSSWSSWSSGPAPASSSFASAQHGLDAVTVNTSSVIERAPTQPDIQGALSRIADAANHRASARVLGATPTVPAGDEGEAALAYLAAAVDTPATLVWRRERRGINHEAVLRSDGTIRLSDGTIYRDPSAAANAAQHTQDVDGWRVWRMGANGPSLAEVLDTFATA
ncbi:MAG: hypothetical protein Q4C85_10350 [Actinomyces sp.]|uniref:restriction system modified-DNA reader domain-containing protein n=1 Tax=Actinomyces sp. TaxID=29317 RepID=UPI0026DD266C|nr:hypothetical protein [Actinomyces sp.]MDO4244138.1 hypothetical protein [Actinomyces sp.]